VDQDTGLFNEFLTLWRYSSFGWSNPSDGDLVLPSRDVASTCYLMVHLALCNESRYIWAEKRLSPSSHNTSPERPSRPFAYLSRLLKSADWVEPCTSRRLPGTNVRKCSGHLAYDDQNTGSMQQPFDPLHDKSSCLKPHMGNGFPLLDFDSTTYDKLRFIAAMLSIVHNYAEGECSGGTMTRVHEVRADHIRDAADKGNYW
ncbi:10830_t:CDS:2, partial [Acaulospora colombiana]